MENNKVSARFCTQDMHILFLTSSEEDYLSDSILIGMRNILGVNCVDYPLRDILYKDCTKESSARVRGNGFTLYTGSLRNDAIDRFQIRPRLERGEFDLIIISDIWRQFGLFIQWRNYLTPSNTIILDGQDSDQLYPYAGFWWRRPYLWFVPRVTKDFLYFKREWTENSQFNIWHRLLPKSVRKFLPAAQNLRTISFAIPDSKIVTEIPIKTKRFARHIVDAEVAAQISDSSSNYAFKEEVNYYTDLQSSEYGITTKRAGWDCLRHYEIAANGCVPCFRSLREKPTNCAPHGLIPMVNCIEYENYNDLIRKISNISPEQYKKMATASIEWAKSNSCIKTASKILDTWMKWKQIKNLQK